MANIILCLLFFSISLAFTIGICLLPVFAIYNIIVPGDWSVSLMLILVYFIVGLVTYFTKFGNIWGEENLKFSFTLWESKRWHKKTQIKIWLFQINLLDVLFWYIKVFVFLWLSMKSLYKNRVKEFGYPLKEIKNYTLSTKIFLALFPIWAFLVLHFEFSKALTAIIFALCILPLLYSAFNINSHVSDSEQQKRESSILQLIVIAVLIVFGSVGVSF